MKKSTPPTPPPPPLPALKRIWFRREVSWENIYTHEVRFVRHIALYVCLELTIFVLS